MGTHHRKGISSIIATLIILGITITLGALFYMYSEGLFNIMTHNANVPMDVELYSTGGNSFVLNLEVQNPTNQYLQINNFRIIGPNGTNLGSWSVSWDVPPAGTDTFYYIGSADQTVYPNTNYVVIFSGLIGDQQFSEAVNVISTD